MSLTGKSPSWRSVGPARHFDAREEIRIVRVATIGLGLFAIALGIAFKGQNVAYMISLAFSIACSSTFPVLVLAIYWKRLTATGAVIGGGVGLLSSLLLTVLGPAIWVKVLGHASPVFPIDPPALITVPLAFLGCVIASLYWTRTEPTPADLRHSPPQRGKAQLEPNQAGRGA